MGSPLRALIRVAVYLGLTLALIPIQYIGVRFELPLALRFPRIYHRLCTRVLGLRVSARGKISDRRPTLFISNHVSYIDITVLGSLLDASFVAKSEIAGWPLFGTLARLQRTVFVDRRGSRAAEHRDDLQARLDAGDSLILFPEGTSGDGNSVLPFKSALFSVAQRSGPSGPVTVQPVTIAYTRLDGLPIGRNLRPYFAWYGDMDLVSHLMGWLGLGTVTVEVAFHEPVSLEQYGSRKALSDHCHDVIANGLAAATSGRGRGHLAPRPSA